MSSTVTFFVSNRFTAPPLQPSSKPGLALTIRSWSISAGGGDQRRNPFPLLSDHHGEAVCLALAAGRRGHQTAPNLAAGRRAVIGERGSTCQPAGAARRSCLAVAAARCRAALAAGDRLRAPAGCIGERVEPAQAHLSAPVIAWWLPATRGGGPRQRQRQPQPERHRTVWPGESASSGAAAEPPLPGAPANARPQRGAEPAPSGPLLRSANTVSSSPARGWFRVTGGLASARDRSGSQSRPPARGRRRSHATVGEFATTTVPSLKRPLHVVR